MKPYIVCVILALLMILLVSRLVQPCESYLREDGGWVRDGNNVDVWYDKCPNAPNAPYKSVKPSIFTSWWCVEPPGMPCKYDDQCVYWNNGDNRVNLRRSCSNKRCTDG